MQCKYFCNAIEVEVRKSMNDLIAYFVDRETLIHLNWFEHSFSRVKIRILYPVKLAAFVT